MCGCYRLRKIAVFWEVTTIDRNFSLSKKSNAVDTRFEHVFVIIGQPNLASSFLKICPRGILQKIPRNSFSSPLKNRKNCWNLVILNVFLVQTKFLAQTLFNRHRVISGSKIGNQTKSQDTGRILRPRAFKSVDSKYFLSFF